MVYARHRRHLSRDSRHGDNLKAFIAAQDARLAIAQVKATGVLTASAIANGDTVTIGSKVYTFQDTLTNADGNVHRTGTLATDLANLVKAITLGAGSGTDYAASMTLHPTATATSDATHLTATAKAFGAGGNSIATTETGAGTAWASATLTGGVTAASFDTKVKLRKYSADEIARAANQAALP